MRSQLLTYSAFYFGLVAIAFRTGWWAARYVSDRMDNVDPRIGEARYGW